MSKQLHDKVTIKQYVDKIFELNEKALKKALDELQEWKNLHNNLQRKMDEEREEMNGKFSHYSTKEEAKEQIKLLWTRMGIVIAFFMLALAAYVAITKK